MEMPAAGSTPDSANLALAGVLGRLPSGLFIVTAATGDGRETGFLASWVQQASFEPPMVTVAVNVKRFIHDWLASSPLLALNLVGDGQKEFLKHFGAGFEPDQPAFEGLQVVRGRTGVPLLAEALGSLEGRVVSQMLTGDHIIYGMEVLDARFGAAFESLQPWVHIRKNGLRY